jgi:hemoglobin-like flavoprotein
MTPEQVALVTASVDAIRPRLTEVAGDFYERLFAAAPEARALFSHDLATQSEKFGRELDEIVAVIPSFGEFVDRTAALGARHATYGVRPSHYDLMRDVLLDTLAAELGDAFTPETKDAWVTAFALLAESMQIGAAAQAAQQRT